MIHSGDLTDNGILMDYELAVERMQGIRAEVVFAPGNHDERNYGDSLFREMVGPVDFAMNVGRVVFMLMDSAIPDSDNGRLGRRRQELLRSMLSNLPDSVIKVVVFHHHLIPVPLSGREKDILEDAGDILSAVLDLGIDLVLMGHRHVRHAIKVNETVLVNAGTTSSARTRGRLGNSFNIVEIMEDRSMTIKEVNIATGEENLLGSFTRTPPRVNG